MSKFIRKLAIGLSIAIMLMSSLALLGQLAVIFVRQWSIIFP